MMKKAFVTLAIILTSICINAHVSAAEKLKIDKAVFTTYPPAIMHHALETAYENPDPAKLLGFVVLEKGGIPAERARFFVTWSDYDYRGVVIHLDENDKITTRRGRPYTYLKPGDVMAVVSYKRFNRTIYLKLLSADVYIPENRRNDKRHSRVSVMLGFKFPKKVIKEDDVATVLATMGEWLKPFPSVTEAKAYSRGMSGKPLYVEEAAPPPMVKQAPAAPAGGSENKRIKTLEEKIEKARKELQEAEKELKDMKEEQ